MAIGVRYAFGTRFGPSRVALTQDSSSRSTVQCPGTPAFSVDRLGYKRARLLAVIPAALTAHLALTAKAQAFRGNTV